MTMPDITPPKELDWREAFNAWWSKRKPVSFVKSPRGFAQMVWHAAWKRNVAEVERLRTALMHIEVAAMDITCERTAIRDAAKAARGGEWTASQRLMTIAFSTDTLAPVAKAGETYPA